MIGIGAERHTLKLCTCKPNLIKMKKALVVGINSYPFAPLHGCVRDATEISSLLKENEDRTLNFDVLLQTDVPKKSKLRELVIELFKDKHDTVLFYFSGHGMITELGGYLVTPDHRNYDEGISMNDILTLANKSPSTNKIIILDCCHSAAITAPELIPGSIGHINEGITILTASKRDEAAMEVKGKGVFTNLLTEALKGGAADINGNITPGSIYAYVDQALGPWEQRPVFKTNVCSFTALRKVFPKISLDVLRKITEFFPEAETLYPLDPSYEYTNDPDTEHTYIKPYANAPKVAIFKSLQKMQAAGLVEPIADEHMYWAAMNGNACRLTPLGTHYWRLVHERKI
jgi:uncharacterized protein YqkB